MSRETFEKGAAMVPQIKKILFATDLTENSRYAFGYAAAMAERYRADLILLHVMPHEIPDNAKEAIRLVLGEDTWRQVATARERRAKDILIGKRTDHLAIRQALAKFYGEVESGSASGAFEEYEIVIRDGNAAAEIVAAAEEYDCQAIVLSTGGGKPGGKGPGDVASSVLHNATVPVLVVPLPKR
jgi:nucleotide-binding universal stress UspA family protein